MSVCVCVCVRARVLTCVSTVFLSTLSFFPLFTVVADMITELIRFESEIGICVGNE